MSDSFYSTNLNIRTQNKNENSQKEKESNEKIDKNLNSIETRESETLTDICSSDNISEIDFISLLDEKLPQYKLRADTIFSHNNCDWIRAPFYIDENELSELTNEQIAFTLDYFIQSGYRINQMTKTYYDIEAVTKLLDEKERDLELAATIGKQLLEKDQQLEEKIEFLEQELVKTSDMVNQLRYEIQLKDNLLKSFIDSEQDAIFEESSVKLSKTTNNENDQMFSSKRINNIETLNEYKRKIEYLEDENDQLRNKADYYEKETIDLELKESSLIDNCFKELEETQDTLRQTQDELKNKTKECFYQQEEINNLFGQIFELQSRIKCLTKDNLDLQSIYESSKSDLHEQIRELKDKYNDCIQMLNKSHEEISVLKRKALKKKSKINYYMNTSSTLDNQPLDSFQINDDNDLESSFIFTPQSRVYSPFMPLNQTVNNSSFAAEVFSTMSRNYRGNFVTQKISQSNNLIKKVKQKLIKSVPGTSTSESCFQSEDENLLLHPAGLEKKFLNCPTPDSVLSTGSNLIHNNIWRSNSLFYPDKLQIVKPIEGSITLQHWQNLATPNFGCLFEERPGISIKGNLSETESDLKEDDRDSLLDQFDFDDDLDNYDYWNKEINREYKNRVLSPTKMQLLATLLEKEESIQNNSEPLIEKQEAHSIFGLFKTMFFNPIQDEKNKKNDFSDPDTPPSSPINLPNNNSFVKIIDSISSYFKSAPTPPATPNNELEDEEEQYKQNESKLGLGFFDQLVNKLKGFNQLIRKNQNTIFEEFSEKQDTKNCSTPPPSPSRLSPPAPDLEDEFYTKDDLEKSAFATVTKLNPLLNKQVDLSLLLKSLSSLKRNQRIAI